MQNFEVIFYEKGNGEEPAKEFLMSLDDKMRAKIIHSISRLKKNDTELREPFSKHLEDGIFELRVYSALTHQEFYIFSLQVSYSQTASLKNSKNSPFRNRKG